MIYFCDRSMARRLPIALSLLGIDIEMHDRYFNEKTQDDEWLECCGRQDWTALSFDRLRFLRGVAGRQALIQHRAGCFVFNIAPHNSMLRMKLIARVWEEIEQRSAHTARPFLFQVNKGGDFIQKV